MAKHNRHGQAALLSESDCAKIRKHLTDPKYRLMWDLARWTGERWGAVLQLLVEDVYSDPLRSHPREHITFRARTRKAGPDGLRQTRQVPLHPTLKEILSGVQPPTSGYLFPSRDYTRPLTLRAADLALRQAIALAGLSHKGISTHSTRVSFITHLHNRGVSPRIIQQLTGHRDPKVLARYIVVSPEQTKEALSLL